MAQVLGTNAKVLYNRLPYGEEGGDVWDNRTFEVSMDEIANKFSIPVSQLKIKKD